MIDANNDDEIQVSEALAVWELSLDVIDSMTSTTGIEAFTNLRKFSVTAMESLMSLDITELANLEELHMDGCDELTSIECAGLVHLQKITLKHLFNLDSLDCTGMVSLEEFRMVNTHIQSLEIANLPNLKVIDLGYQPSLTSLDCTGLISLEELIIDSALSMQTLTTGSLPFLIKLHTGDLPLVASLDLSGCPVLDDLELDISSVDSESVFLNLKNGKTTYSNFSVSIGDYYGVFICVDEGEESYFSEIMNDNSNTYLSTYCSFTPGGDYNTIGGAITFDNSGSCGTGGILNKNVKVTMNDGAHSFTTFSNWDGLYNFYVPSGTFTVTADMGNDWFTITPPSASITIPETDNGAVTQNFCITPNGIHPDVEVYLSQWGSSQPGFDAQYRITYVNKGNQILSGAVTFTYDENVLDYTSATPAASAYGPWSATWDYTALQPFETRHIFVTLNLNGPMEVPPLNLGDMLPFTISVTPVAGDETPADNDFTANIEVTGSYDPNDITCLEGERVSPEKIGEYLHYNINFENTGTAPATFIVVKDIIDETKFDLGTFRLLDASHAVKATLTGNKAEFYFDNIDLGPLEKGNVVFKIKTLNTLQVNDDVSQQADIFFDYNWPIQTNEAVTVFEVLNSNDFEKDSSVKIFPNPAKDRLNITADGIIENVGLYDLQGRLLETDIVNDLSAAIDLSARQAGMYFVKVTTVKGVRVESIVRE